MGFTRKRSNFGRYAVFVLIFNIFVILWGGYVSASGSGDGCGASWPLCGTSAEHSATQLETYIELFHRATSGLALIAVAIMLIWALRAWPRGHHVRFAAWGSAIFILGEAAIGAYIVIASLVADNINIARAFSQPIHLINTYLLLGFLGLTIYYGTGSAKINLRTNPAKARQLILALISILILSAFGTLASLASTIFPSETFLAGVQKDFAANAHYLVRLRIWHPIIATAVGGYLYWMVQQFKETTDHGRQTTASYLPTIILSLFALQYLFGALNAILLTPIWLQLTHLLLSDLIWLAILWLGATALSNSTETIISEIAMATD